MGIYDIAVSNVKGNLYRYLMYYLSNSFAVTVFFIFSNFIFHPSMSVKNIGGHPVAQIGAVNGLLASQVIIVIFSILFVGYSTSIFLKSRGREFGLLSLYGMTKGQIRKYVFIENTVISVLSIVTGIMSGMIFSKLFFMAMEVFLEVSLPLNISLKALGLSSLIFFILFEVISVLMLFQIRNKEIVQQLKASKIPKTIPDFSKTKAGLGLVLMIIGYGVAWFVPGGLVPLAMIPVILIVVAGTYFLFTQLSIAIANWILKNEKVLYKKTNIVAYSQIIFKLQDTAKVLFLASILGAFTFTATETMYSFFTEVPRLEGFDTPHEIAIVQKGDTLYDDNGLEKVKAILNKNGVKLEGRHEVKGVILTDGEKDRKYFTISNSDYNKLAKSLGKEALDVKPDEIVYNYDTNYNRSLKKTVGDKIQLAIGEDLHKFNLGQEVQGSVSAIRKLGYYHGALILNDKDFKEVSQKVKQENKAVYTGINIKKWQRTYKASMEIKDSLGKEYKGNFYSKAIPYKETRKSFGMVLFIGFFIAFLFFIASGSIIYFKLFNEIKQDGIEYGILKKIGTTNKEINDIITKQIGIIFFLPFIVSTSHSLFALKSLSNLMQRNLITNGLTVMVGYLIFQIIYFMIIRAIYIDKMKNTMASS
jgi:putative ABC transport system permease protein